MHRLLSLAIGLFLSASAMALNETRVEQRVDEAMETFGVTGKGVTVAVLDRGITWDHPDFIRPNGKTRIKAILDQSGQNFCAANNPDSIVYTEAQINDALENGTELGHRDAVGHGTATAGTAAGNGRALPDKRYVGIAPEADLIIAKITSEGAPAHDGQPAEASFNGCIDDAIEWAAAMMDELNQPGVLIINSGVQSGPMDGTGAVSRKLAEVFPQDTPGRIVVIPSGDEGRLDTHAGGSYNSAQTTEFSISRASGTGSQLTAWYSGEVPAEVSVEFDDGTSAGPIAPGGTYNQDGIRIFHYTPGNEFYPWQSTSGDYAVYMDFVGHATTGKFKIRALGAGTGRVDAYTDVLGPNLTPITVFTDNLVPGRLNDYATTPTVIVSGDYVIRTDYIDHNGVPRSISNEGLPGELWHKSSPGPTRDGRDYGVDVASAGQNMFAPVGPDSWWGASEGNQPQGGEGMYIRFGGTSGSAPVNVGAVALMLEVNPALTTRQARQILRDTARRDSHTGNVPNLDWGWGKMDVFEAVTTALAYRVSGPWFNAGQSGHGWLVETLQDPDGGRRIVAYWYVYQDGKPVWLIAVGPLVGTHATLEAFISSGGEFPPDFDGADTVPWGTLEFDFNPDGSGTASWTTDFAGFSSGSMPITQISPLSGEADGCRSGSFYNAGQSGHGIVVEVLDIPGVPQLFVAWYVYLNGEQVWMVGLGSLDGDTATIPFDTYAGALFPPDFKASDVVITPWGTLTLTFVGPDNIEASWQTSRPGYSSGSLDLERITTLGGQDCLD